MIRIIIKCPHDYPTMWWSIKQTLSMDNSGRNWANFWSFWEAAVRCRAKWRVKPRQFHHLIHSQVWLIHCKGSLQKYGIFWVILLGGGGEGVKTRIWEWEDPGGTHFGGNSPQNTFFCRRAPLILIIVVARSLGWKLPPNKWKVGPMETLH